MRNIALESDPFGGRFLRGPALRRALLRIRGCLPASRAAFVSSSPCVVDRMLHPRSHRFVRRRGSLCYFVVSCTVRGSIDEIACPRVVFSGPGKFIPFLTWSFETAAVGSHDSSMLFRKNCQNACANERDSINEGSKADEMPHPGGEGRVGETKRVKDRVEVLKRTKCRVRGRSRGATKQARCCAQGLVAGGASVEACLYAKESRPIDGFEEKSLSHAKATIIRLKWRP